MESVNITADSTTHRHHNLATRKLGSVIILSLGLLTAPLAVADQASDRALDQCFKQLEKQTPAQTRVIAHDFARQRLGDTIQVWVNATEVNALGIQPVKTFCTSDRLGKLTEFDSQKGQWHFDASHAAEKAWVTR